MTISYSKLNNAAPDETPKGYMSHHMGHFKDMVSLVDGKFTLVRL